MEAYIDEMLSLMKEDGNIRACCGSSVGWYQYFTFSIQSVLAKVNNIREYLTPYRAVKYDCVKLKGDA